MKFTNSKIYQIGTDLSSIAEINQYIPAKANFFLQKNIQAIAAAAQEVEESRLKIAQHYGVLNEAVGQYDIPDDKKSEAIQELNDLFDIEQDIDIKTININDLGSAEFTPAQMKAIMFMIED